MSDYVSLSVSFHMLPVTRVQSPHAMVPSDSTPTLQLGFGGRSLSSSQPTPQPSPPNVLLIVFIHGFKGDDTTFGNFPSRLQHILSETVQDTVIESIVFPAYDTKGDLPLNTLPIGLPP